MREQSRRPDGRPGGQVIGLLSQGTYSRRTTGSSSFRSDGSHGGQAGGGSGRVVCPAEAEHSRGELENSSGQPGT